MNKIKQDNGRALWDAHPNILIWVLCMGGSFAPTKSIRTYYVELLHSDEYAHYNRPIMSWPGLLAVLKQFIWSDIAFMKPVKAFWEDYRNWNEQQDDPRGL